MKKNTIRILAAALFVVAAPAAFGQKNAGPPNELDKQYTPDKNSVLNNEGSNASSKESAPHSIIKNAVKFNPFLLGRATAAFFYERSLGRTFSIEGGLGACLGKDYLQTITTVEDVSITGEGSSSIKVSDMMLNSTFVSGPNIFTSFAIRLYYNDAHAFDGSYVQLGIRYNTNTVLLESQTSSSSVGNFIIPGDQVVIQNLHANLLYGYQVHTNGHVKTTHDFYFGFGIKGIVYDAYQRQEEIVFGVHTGDYINVKTGTRESVFLPTILFGYAFGFGF